MNATLTLNDVFRWIIQRHFSEVLEIFKTRDEFYLERCLIDAYTISSGRDWKDCPVFKADFDILTIFDIYRYTYNEQMRKEIVLASLRFMVGTRNLKDIRLLSEIPRMQLIFIFSELIRIKEINRFKDMLKKHHLDAIDIFLLRGENPKNIAYALVQFAEGGIIPSIQDALVHIKEGVASDKDLIVSSLYELIHRNYTFEI